MRDQDKPFVLYRRGPWNFNIVPRGRKGWMLMGLWIALLAPLIAAFEIYADAHEGEPEFFVALGLFLAAMLVWTIAMIRWMKARAEIIDVEQMLKFKREQERKRR
jgi:hypothetical protein